MRQLWRMLQGSPANMEFKMANKAFTKSRDWYRAHMLNWLLYCTKGYRQILRGYIGDRKLSDDIRGLVRFIEADVARAEGHIELKIHEHAKKAMEK